MPDVYKKWEPVQDITEALHVDAVHDDIEGLRILMVSAKPGLATLRISFGRYYAYRNADESYRSKLWEAADFEDWSWQFYCTQSSDFIDWVCDQSHETYDRTQMILYLIKTDTDVIEVITWPDIVPAAEWLLSNR